MTFVQGCPECSRLTSGVCAAHMPSQIALLESIQHRHVWVFDAYVDGMVVYHCDAHYPPVVVMVVAPNVEVSGPRP